METSDIINWTKKKVILLSSASDRAAQHRTNVPLHCTLYIVVIVVVAFSSNSTYIFYIKLKCPNRDKAKINARIKWDVCMSGKSSNNTSILIILCINTTLRVRQMIWLLARESREWMSPPKVLQLHALYHTVNSIVYKSNLFPFISYNLPDWSQSVVGLYRCFEFNRSQFIYSVYRLVWARAKKKTVLNKFYNDEFWRS